MIKEKLIEAKAIIGDRSNWTRGVLAKDNDGKPVPPCDPRACQWCALGAISKVCDTYEEEVLLGGVLTDSILTYAAFMGHKMIDEVNDSGGFTLVHKLFDRAIKDAKD